MPNIYLTSKISILATPYNHSKQLGWFFFVLMVTPDYKN